MISYYLQHRRPEAVDRARAIAEALGPDCIVVSPWSAPLGQAARWIALPDDSAGALASWLDTHQPHAVLVDGSAEHVRVASGACRPAVAVASPGYADDVDLGPAYDLADTVLAPWPADIDAPHWPSAREERTVHVGAIGWAAAHALSNRVPRPRSDSRGSWRCLSISPTASGPGPRDRQEILAETPAWQWWFATERDLLHGGPAWDSLLRADVLICAPTATNLAAAAAAEVSAILVLPDRPSAEHVFLAESARRTAPVVVLDRLPLAQQWRGVLSYAHGLDGRSWDRWSPQQGLDELREVLEVQTQQRARQDVRR